MSHKKGEIGTRDHVEKTRAGMSVHVVVDAVVAVAVEQTSRQPPTLPPLAMAVTNAKRCVHC